MKVLVVGATGGLGRVVVAAAVEPGPAHFTYMSVSTNAPRSDDRVGRDREADEPLDWRLVLPVSSG